MTNDRCEKCIFSKSRTVGSFGPEDAEIVVIGESPGPQEVRHGRPFVPLAPSGKILWDNIPVELHDKILILNAMSCHPPKKKDQHTLIAGTRACRNRILTEIKKHPRKLIIALGNPASWTSTGNFGIKITQQRGKFFDSELAELGILVALHPAAILRGTGTLRQFTADLEYAFSIYRGKNKKEPIVPKIIICDNDKDIKEAERIITSAEYVASDIETEGFDRQKHEILATGFSVDPKYAYIFPDHKHEAVKRILEHKKPRFIWHNGKFDIAFLRRESINARVDEDTMLLSYALDERPGYHDLEGLQKDILGAPEYKNMVKPYIKGKGKTYADIPKPILYEYLGLDVSGTIQIFHHLKKRVDSDEHCHKLYHKTLIPASEFLYHLENTGMYVDDDQLQRNAVRLINEIEKAKELLCEIAGYEINPNSPKQVAQLLYDELRLAKGKGRGTGKDILEKLPNHPAVDTLLKHRKAAKAYSTYVKGIELAKSDIDNRVHSTYLIHGTRTGRLSSRNPNMQNIPRDPELRAMFIAGPGNIILEFDYNQAELRSLALLSGDPELCRVYLEGKESLHKIVARKHFGDNYDIDQYVRAKAVNFGIVYGRQAQSIAEEFDITITEAQMMIDGWFNIFPVAGKFINKCRSMPLKHANIITMFGRKKRHEIVTQELLYALQNEASNFPHQSIASDLTLHSGIAALPTLQKKWSAQIVNIIHDALIVECKDDERIIKPLSKFMLSTMESIPLKWGLNRIPFLADMKKGYAWGKLKEVE